MSTTPPHNGFVDMDLILARAENSAPQGTMSDMERIPDTTELNPAPAFFFFNAAADQDNDSHDEYYDDDNAPVRGGTIEELEAWVATGRYYIAGGHAFCYGCAQHICDCPGAPQQGALRPEDVPVLRTVNDDIESLENGAWKAFFADNLDNRLMSTYVTEWLDWPHDVQVMTPLATPDGAALGVVIFLMGIPGPHIGPTLWRRFGPDEDCVPIPCWQKR